MLAIPPGQSSSIRLKQVHPQKVVVLGDSLVYGYGDPQGGGWVERPASFEYGAGKFWPGVLQPRRPGRWGSAGDPSA